MRIYRVTKSDPPTEADMRSYWDLGRRPFPYRPQDEAAYREVSAFVSAELAARTARLRGLGDYIAELDIPDDTSMSRTARGHLGLRGLAPAELLGMVINVRSVSEV